MTPFGKRTIFEEITWEVIGLIKQGEWQPGERLDGESALSERFAISRNSVREVLKALEISGIVESRQGRGTYLSTDALNDINKLELLWALQGAENGLMDIMETRLIVEPTLGYFAAQRGTAEDFAKLEEIIVRSREELTNGSYRVPTALRFHQLISETSKNVIVSTFINSIVNELSARRFMNIDTYFDRTRPKREINEREEILAALKRREAGRVKTLIFAHIHATMKELTDFHETKNSSTAHRAIGYTQ